MVSSFNYIVTCISKCMHGLQACLFFKYITIAAFGIYAQHCEDAAKRGALNSFRNYIVDHGKSLQKSWNCVFEFLWEP